MKANSKVVMGVDIGGTKIACALLKGKKLITPIYKEKTPYGKKILKVVEKFYKKLSQRYNIVAVGVSTAGMVNNSGKIVGSVGNIPGYNGINVKKTLEVKCKVPVVVENDANSAAYAVYKIGLGKSANPLLMITLGTGVGGGLVIDGKLVRGAHFAGAEIGHIKLGYFKQRLCTCGRYDCLEAFASGNGLIALAKYYFPKNKKMHSTRALFKLAQSKKKKESLLAVRAIEDWHFYIALGITNLVQFVDPEKVVLSGGLTEQIDIKYLRKLTAGLLLDALKKPAQKDMIVKSKLGNDAGLVGAALLANE